MRLIYPCFRSNKTRPSFQFSFFFLPNFRNPAIKIIGNEKLACGDRSKPEPRFAELEPVVFVPRVEPSPASPLQAASSTRRRLSKEEASSRLEALLRPTSSQVVRRKNNENTTRVTLNQQFELDLTQLWSESHQNCTSGDLRGQKEAGKRYRSSIRIMVRPEVVQHLQRPIRANSSDGFQRPNSSSSSSSSSADASSDARSAKKMSAAGVRTVDCSSSSSGPHQQRPIVKEQFR